MFATGEQAWVQEVFGGCQLDDARRTKRLVDRGARLAHQADASMAKCWNGDSAAHLGRYRFLRNDAVSAEQIAEGGFDTAIRQVDKSQRLLALEEWRVLCAVGGNRTRSPVYRDAIGEMGLSCRS